MDAHKLWMLRDFIGTNKVLFKIPVYQRNYDWSESNVDRLLEDIGTIMETGEKHFLGTIVFMAAGDGGFTLQEYIIIDGQQRLTTLMIILKALAQQARETGDSSYQEIEEQYLCNRFCEEKYKVKLKPVKSDNEQFLLMLNGKIDEMDEENHLWQNYTRCKERFEKWCAKGISCAQILDALTKLEMVEIVLTKGEDDPQVIFESINSTGLELSNADLIRNFLLMNADDQEKLYEDYWLYIEKALRNKTDYSNLDQFFMQYILYKTGTPVNSRQLYGRFVKYFKDNRYTHEGILKELKYYADIFKAFVYGNAEYSNRINNLLKRLRLLNQTTCYPFLLHVFDDYHNGTIDEKVVEDVLQFILSYLLRRLVCGVPSNTLRGLFIYLYNRVFKVEANKKKYYGSINKFLFTVNTKDVVPSEAEFERALQTANIYGNLALCRFLLTDIENGDGKEKIGTAGLTVEHIMPQTLTADWNYISVEDHEEYLHTLGNLSVTGYNSELSNKSFEEKKKIIEENSKAAVLNKEIIGKDAVDRWDIDAIKARGKRLAGIVKQRYSIQRVVDDSIEFEYVLTCSVKDYDSVTGKRLVSFKLLGETYRQNYFALMLLDVIKILEKRTPGKLAELAREGFTFSTIKNGHIHINTDGKDMRLPQKAAENVYVELNLSSSSCVRFIAKLLSEYEVPEDQFSFSIIAEASDDGEESEG